jgi:hypothetical protein
VNLISQSNSQGKKRKRERDGESRADAGASAGAAGSSSSSGGADDAEGDDRAAKRQKRGPLLCHLRVQLLIGGR